MEKLDKKTYRGIVKFTLESMLNLSKTDKNYNLAADTIYYYENTIVPEEIKILNKLYDEKHIVYSPEKIIVTRKFYNYIQDILATGYVEEFIRNE